MAAKTLNWVGHTLAGGRYKVMAKLGEGGMGFVYRARDRNLETDLVIKVPQPAMLQDPEFAARFTREIRSLVKLAHPHIVKITDVGEHDGLPFAVMQYLPGGSLRDRQRPGPGEAPGPLHPEELRGWLEDVAGALDFIHGQKYVHRDIKPENILFDAHGHSYLSDFGIAKAMTDFTSEAARTVHTSTGMVVGTPRYMAPELLMDKPYDGRVDQYALAVTVFEILSGRPPFDGPTAVIMAQHLSQAPPALHELVPSVPPALSAAVLRGMAKEPDKRFATCKAFAAAVLEGLAAKSSPGAPTERPGLPTAVPTAGGQFQCPACGKAVRVPASAIGKRGRCPACQAVFQIAARPAAPTLPLSDQSKTETPAGGSRTIPQTIRSAPSDKRRVAPLLPGRLSRLGLGAKAAIAGGSLVAFILLAFGFETLSRKKEKSIPPVPDGPPGEIARLEGHGDTVWSVAFLPDGKRALTASGDKTVRLWDLEGGKELRGFGDHPRSVYSAAIMPDGGRVLTGCADHIIRLFSDTGLPQRQLHEHTDAVWSVAVAADGRTALSGSSDQTLRLWDLDLGIQSRCLRGHTSGVYSVALAPDGRRALSGSASPDSSVRLWDLTNEQELQRFVGHTDSVWSVALSADGRRAASAGHDHVARIWDVDSGQELSRFTGHTMAVYSVALSPDGRRALSGSSDRTVRLWDVATGQELHRFDGHTMAVYGVAFSPDGTRALSGSADRSVRLWRLPP